MIRALVLALTVLLATACGTALEPAPVPPAAPTVTVTVTPTVVEPPPPTTTTTAPPATTTAPPATTTPPVVPANDVSNCVQPAGMTKLQDQDPSDSQKPWKRTPGQKAVFYYPTKGMTAEWRSYVEYAAAAWNRSPCVDLRVVDTCPAGSNCIPIKIGDGGGDDGNFNDKLDSSKKFTVGGDIEILSTLGNTSAKVTPPLPPGGERLNVMVHEIGHSIALAHRKGLIDQKTGRHLLMNEGTFNDVMDPDAIDYQNLAFSYTVLQK